MPSIRGAAAAFLGWRYATRDADVRYPYPGRGLPLSKVWRDGDPRATNCCAFVAAVLAYARPLASWDDDTYSGLMIMDPDRPFSPCEAVAAAGAADLVPLHVATRWHVCQGWRSLHHRPPGDDGVARPYVSTGDRGHTFLWRADGSGPPYSAGVALPGDGWCLEAGGPTAPDGVALYRATWADRVAPYRAGVGLSALGLPGRT